MWDQGKGLYTEAVGKSWSSPGRILVQVDGFTHLYTLVLRPDLSYEVRIDGQVAESGDIEYDWNLVSLKSASRKTETEPKGWEQV